MTKQSGDEQLPLDLPPRKENSGQSREQQPRKKNIVPFVDASTRAIREEARKRVDASGIFESAPKNQTNG